MITCPNCKKELEKVNGYGQAKVPVEIDEAGQATHFGQHANIILLGGCLEL